jgi:hypothetical protein
VHLWGPTRNLSRHHLRPIHQQHHEHDDHLIHDQHDNIDDDDTRMFAWRYAMPYRPSMLFGDLCLRPVLEFGLVRFALVARGQSSGDTIGRSVMV